MNVYNGLTIGNLVPNSLKTLTWRSYDSRQSIYFVSLSLDLNLYSQDCKRGLRSDNNTLLRPDDEPNGGRGGDKDEGCGGGRIEAWFGRGREGGVTWKKAGKEDLHNHNRLGALKCSEIVKITDPRLRDSLVWMSVSISIPNICK